MALQNDPGGTTVVRDPHTAKRKPYFPPTVAVLDAKTARAKLTSEGVAQDDNVRKMLSVIDKQLGKKAPSPPPAFRPVS